MRQRRMRSVALTLSCGFAMASHVALVSAQQVGTRPPVAPGQAPGAPQASALPQAPSPPGGAPPRAAQGPAAAPPVQLGPAPLTPEEQRALDTVLAQWEAKSAGLTNLQAKFTLWEHNPTFNVVTKHGGQLKYQSPDRGEYMIDEEFEDASDKAKSKPVEGERWCCDGDAVHEFRAAEKTIISHELPQHLRGQAIQHSPLPFLFNAKANDLKARYFMRIVTPANQAGRIWIEATPRYQQDAANFKFATIILKQDTFLPAGLRLTLPASQQGREHTKTYGFQDYKINEKKIFGLFGGEKIGALQTPKGWQVKVEPAVDPATTAPTNVPATATKPGPLNGILPKR